MMKNPKSEIRNPNYLVPISLIGPMSLIFLNIRRFAHFGFRISDFGFTPHAPLD
jgi:hypothetical protein